MESTAKKVPQVASNMVEQQPECQVGILLADVRPEPVPWLWPGWIPLGNVTVIDGDPGLGKSSLTADLAARVSQGRPMPNDTGGGEPAGVVILSAEDDPAHTIVPRLRAAGADLSRILAVTTVPDDSGEGEHVISLPEDLDSIELAVERVGAKLLIIDPFTAMLGSGVNSHKDQGVRPLFHQLKLLAERTGCAIVIVRHLNKTGGGSAMYRGGGSIGIIAAARAGLVVARDPDDENARVLAMTKMNLGPEQPSLAFRLEGTDSGACRTVWEGVSRHSADTLVSQPPDAGERTERREAMRFLVDALAEGPMPVVAVQESAKLAGLSLATLRRAKKDLGVKSDKMNYVDSWWVWFLPPEDAHRLTKVLNPQVSAFEHLPPVESIPEIRLEKRGRHLEVVK